MKKLISISNHMGDFLSSYAEQINSTQSRIVENALTLYFQKYLGVMTKQAKNKPLKGQTSIYNIEKEVRL